MAPTRMIIISLPRTNNTDQRRAIFVPICNAVPHLSVYKLRDALQKPAFTVLHENCTRAQRAKRLTVMEERERDAEEEERKRRARRKEKKKKEKKKEKRGEDIGTIF